MGDTTAADVALAGSFLNAFAAAGESLQILLATEEIGEYDNEGWYALADWNRLISRIDRYQDPEPILVRLGMEMIHSWFRVGPGRHIVSRSVDFLRHQVGSTGYDSVVRGPTELKGSVELLELDEVRGTALVRDSGVLDDAVVEGVFLGGMSVAGDTLYHDIAVRRCGSERLVDIRYVTRELTAVVPGPEGRPLRDIEWRLLQLSKESARSERYWSSINRTLNAAFAELQILATRDPLTGLLNRREFLRQVDVEFARHRRHVIPVTVLYMDLDEFKSINDHHGHHVGDAVLVAFAEICQQSSREHDVFGRIGGEEFAALLPHTTMDRGVVVAERILTRLREARVEAGTAMVGVTASIGIAEATSGHDVDVVLKQADERLLEAKRAGRDRVVAD